MIRWIYKIKTYKALSLNSKELSTKSFSNLNYMKESLYNLEGGGKFEVRELNNRRIDEKYLVSIYGVWESIDDIPFNILPDEFVINVHMIVEV